MSRTLPFAARLLAMGRNLETLGQSHAACKLFRRLASFPELPAGLSEEAHTHLAELQLKWGQLKKARRGLTAALAQRPDNAHYHYLMARAVEDDDACAPERALAHYRRCTKLEPDDPVYWCDFGLCALGAGEADEGLTALRRAHELAPDDPEILGPVIDGLWQAGEGDEAQKLLRAALFRNPRDSRFHDLCRHHQFQLLYAERQKAKRQSHVPTSAEPALLPFIRPSDGPARTVGKKQIRHDLPSGTPGPKRLSRPKSNRQAQS
jgi:tetratricopeptide (TPR) repeat protein